MEQNNENRTTSIVPVEHDSRPQSSEECGGRPNWTWPNSSHAYRHVKYQESRESGWAKFWRILGLFLAIGLFRYLCSYIF